ncbi:MAG: acyl CoA:acetate/3-ketoacid CoA transferase [Hyphomicrobiaceae bacterium]
MPNKLISPKAAAALISDGDVLTTSGFVGIGVPDELLIALEERFKETGSPIDLTLLFAAGQGDGETRGLNRLGHTKLLKRVVGGHWGLIPKIARLALDGSIEAYNLPQGVISHLYRDIAAGKPGTLTPVGLDTFVDPRIEGGKVNPQAGQELVELIEIAGEEFLFYKAMPIHVALLRGTTADPLGNVTMEREALIIDNLSQAMAAKNSGGLVIVQVERTVARGTLNPREVEIPGALVDAIVVAQAENHMQTYATAYSHTYSGRFRAPPETTTRMPLDARKVIARRAAFELPVNGIVNLGIGMPEGVAAIAAEESLLQHVTLTAEPGVIGGQPASGLDFGAAVNTDAIISQNHQFDFYDGGGLDIAVLGMAEADACGNVNVSRFGSRLAGAGGFINISQNARRIVFTGTFTAGGLITEIKDGEMCILREGQSGKFVQHVGQITFSGDRAKLGKKPILYVTERCVLELTPTGMRLIEVAPGVDLERDILEQMAFAPIIDEFEVMDERIFRDDVIDLKSELLHLDLNDRIALDANNGRLFINFEKFRVRSRTDVEQIRTTVEAMCTGLTDRVDVIVNYDGAHIDEEVVDAYAEMVKNLEDRFYRTVTRYAGSAFMRAKLGRAFERQFAPHIFETAEEARAFIDQAK